MMDDNLLDGYEHGLYRGHPPPSQELLSAWLDQNGAFVNPSLRITEMEDGKGWRITSDSDLDAFDLRELLLSPDHFVAKDKFSVYLK